jgi:hypothetical protein
VRARVGWGALTPLRVTDCYADGGRQHRGALLGRVTLFHAADVNTARSAAARAAIESVVFAPPSVLPGRGVTWRAETDSIILARFDLPPERPEVRLRIDEHGAIRTVSALRWSNVGEKTFQYIPFGGDVHAEHGFGDLVLPCTLSVGWWFDTPRYAAFSAPRSTRSPQCSKPSHAALRGAAARRQRDRPSALAVEVVVCNQSDLRSLSRDDFRRRHTRQRCGRS